MTDEELAKEWVKNNGPICIHVFAEHAFLAGLKAGETKAKKEIEEELLKCYQGYLEEAE